MSKLSTDIRTKCRVYSGDTDGFRISLHRLEDYINSRDEAMLAEVQAIRKELSEQKPLLDILIKTPPTSPGEA